jgi:WD40 repeat protein
VTPLRKLFAFAPAWMWLFWLAGAIVVGFGLTRGREPEPRFLVTTGVAVEIWHGGDYESTMLKFDDGSTIIDVALASDRVHIAFVRVTPAPTQTRPDFGVDLYTARIDGSDVRPLLLHSTVGEYIETVTWLPGGSEIAYAILTPSASGDLDKRVEAVDVATGSRRRLVEGADRVAPLGDSGRLMVRLSTHEGNETPAIYDLATGKLTELPKYNGFLVYVGSFALSPDGKQVALGAADPRLSFRHAGRGLAYEELHPILQDVWLMDPDGASLHRLAEIAVDSPSLAWSPDGRQIYALSPVGFWRIDAVSGSLTKIADGTPNGRIKLLPGR